MSCTDTVSASPPTTRTGTSRLARRPGSRGADGLSFFTVDGKAYAIGFEMRLPKAWNGRFYYQGNGGLDGSVKTADGALGGGPLTGALMQGFAVISSDAGHSGPQTPYFGAEAQSRLDYGYQAVAKLTPMAKALIATAYGKGPDRSYLGGCSNGGRHALVEAARGQAYDGYLIGAPGYRLPNAALAQLWGAQQWAPLAVPGATTQHPLNPSAKIPDLSGAFTKAERQLVADAILGKCDALDGARDGMVQAMQACQAAFNIKTDVATCTGDRNGQCLSAAQKSAVRRSCQTIARASGSPLSRSHATTVSRWLVMPMARTRDASSPMAVRAAASVSRQISAASCSTQPGLGKRVVSGCWATRVNVPSASTSTARYSIAFSFRSSGISTMSNFAPRLSSFQMIARISTRSSIRPHSASASPTGCSLPMPRRGWA